MTGKIALEEHFGATDPNIVEQSAEHFSAAGWPEHRAMLLDIQDDRLRQMDEGGIELAVLSLLSPGIQSLWEPGQAVDWARRLNDFEAEQISRRPDRFAGFAALPMQDPDQAITELRRCVRELGFVGAMINGFSQVGAEDTAVYLDDARYRAFWAAVQELDVPIYLHPRDALPSRSQIYQGHPWLLGSAWGFSVETGTHALRLMGSGLFDTFPRLQVILGHFGELLPFNIWRTDHRIEVAPRGIPARRPFGHYLRNNFHLTISGNYRTPALLNVLLEVGADRVLFATDYPFERMIDASKWFDDVEINDADRAKISHGNARQLLRLG